MTGHKVERALDALTVRSLFHGPLLLTAQSQEQQFRTFSFFTILDALRQRAPFPAPSNGRSVPERFEIAKTGPEVVWTTSES
ncbi:hypothetical protein ACH4MW_32780 [Streptomyces luteogriseus]|uniref:hypothetical protein n=1 Tax=Streptomyces luteogriseus TaxID=68233 RepID=UPI00379A26A7